MPTDLPHYFSGGAKIPNPRKEKENVGILRAPSLKRPIRAPVIATVFFLAGPDGRRGPDCPDVLFVGFRTDFATSVRVLVASAGVLALAGLRPAGPQKPQVRGAHPLRPLTMSLTRASKAQVV